MSSLPKERLVHLIATLLSQRGDSMVAELEKKVATGQSLTVKGIQVDTGVLSEALAKHKAASMSDSAAELPPKSPPKVAPSSPAKKSSARWAVPSAGGVARWTPGVASASLLTAKALSECDMAEPFACSARVSTGAKVVVFTRPDIQSERLGKQMLTDSSPVEVVARFLSQSDGRVYLRLKAEKGWATTRSLEDLEVVLLTSEEGQPPLDPDKFRQKLRSPASEVLQVLDEREAFDAGSASHAAADDADEGQDDDQSDGADDAEGEEEEDEAEDAEVEPDEQEQDAHKDDAADGGGAEGKVAAVSPSKASPMKAKKRVPRKFRVSLGRIAILSKPCAAQLTAAGHKCLQKGEQFIADAAFFQKAEQRVYVRLTRGRGWVCERSRADLHRLAIVRCRTAKGPLSKQSARRAAFQGRDTAGATKMTRDDLIKNSQGKIVSKKMSEAAKKRKNPGMARWTEAVKKARAELGITGFAAVKKGTELYEKSQGYFKQLPAG